MAAPPTPGTTRAAGPTELSSQLRLAVLRLARRLRQHAADDITPSQLSALSVLAREGRMTLTRLAEAERVQPPSASRVVDALVARGLVSRTPCESDRRVAWVDATPEGRALVDRIRRRRDAYLARRLRDLDPEELGVLARAATLLERLTEDVRP